MYAGFASKASEIFGWDHKWTLPGNLAVLHVDSLTAH